MFDSLCSSVLYSFCCQVTYQTKQLTAEFEKQSQYIVCLLAELQQKDSALLSMEEELQRCKQELELFKSQRQGTESSTTFEGSGQQKQGTQAKSCLETPGPHPSEEKQETVTCDPDRLTPVSDSEMSQSGEQHLTSSNSSKTERSHDREEVELSQDRAMADVADSHALWQDHQLLQETSGLNNPVDDSRGARTGNSPREEKHKDQDILQNQRPIAAAPPCLAEPKSPTRPHDIAAKGQMQIERCFDMEQGNLEREDDGAEGELKAACDSDINYLQEQVCNLFPLHESFSRAGPAFCSFLIKILLLVSLVIAEIEYML